jgi:hypothetical protein
VGTGSVRASVEETTVEDSVLAPSADAAVGDVVTVATVAAAAGGSAGDGSDDGAGDGVGGATAQVFLTGAGATPASAPAAACVEVETAVGGRTTTTGIEVDAGATGAAAWVEVDW